MRKIYYLLLAALLAVIPVACSEHALYQEGDSGAAAAAALADRVLPSSQSHFFFKTVPSMDGKDYFNVFTKKGKLHIYGNNANSMAMGLNWYLRHCCGVDVGWFSWDKIKMPRELPVIDEGECYYEARVDKR
ncbi:MAG: alpha-N-acetylglucosaminidase N-terminal domain-containing protein, partial [Bacteroidales bacterium]|nr:alpha-N-acetylglucosaminidase N-terminal domain-containing protein [Bacteroidales bacterium]